MKIKEVLPIVDDVIAVYQKNKPLIMLMGDTDIEKIASLVETVKRFIK